MKPQGARPLVLFFLSLALVPRPSFALPGGIDGGFAWSFEARGGPDRETSAVARSAAGRLASGDRRGLTIWQTGQEARRIALRAPVRDLAFDAGGRLFVATAGALFQVDRELHGVRDISPPGGERARAVHRISAAGPEVAVATDAGVFWRRGAAPWRRVDAAVGDGEPAQALALVLRGARPSQLWIGGARGLFVAEPSSGLPARAQPLPDASGPVIDLFWDGLRLFVLTDAALIAIGEETRAFPLQAAPGAERHRVSRTGDGFFLATARGLWRATSIAGPWRRAADPAGVAGWVGLVAWQGGVALAGPRGLLLGVPMTTQPAWAAASPSSEATCQPPIAAVQRRVLEVLRLRGDPVASMRRGVRKRGWLPTLRLEGAYAVDRKRGSDLDQSYVSQGFREFRDWDRDRSRTKDVAVVMTWELGELFYHPEQIDVSTEARRLIELRDDILDEVNQLFFDRERTLRDGGDPLRAAQHAAGLDAWTGGWFTRALDACP